MRTRCTARRNRLMKTSVTRDVRRLDARSPQGPAGSSQLITTPNRRRPKRRQLRRARLPVRRKRMILKLPRLRNLRRMPTPASESSSAPKARNVLLVNPVSLKREASSLAVQPLRAARTS